MVNTTEHFLLLKANVKAFEKALANSNTEQLRNIANVLVMNTDLLLLEVARVSNRVSK